MNYSNTISEDNLLILSKGGLYESYYRNIYAYTDFF